MKKIEYFCNLCGEKKEKKELKAFYWVCAKTPQGYELVEDVDSCHKHICESCIDIVKKS